MRKDSCARAVNLVGHPYAPIGMGEHVRCTYRAMRSVMCSPGLVDIYNLNQAEADDSLEFAASITTSPADINIFHINGNEVDQAMAHLDAQKRWNGYQVIYPAWELSRYPAEWAEKLERFDEIWAPSIFIQDAIKASCRKPVLHMPLACDVVLSSFLSRRYFGLPEHDYTFLFFFDTRSFVARKNPFAVIEAFQEVLKARPYAKARLVIKINGADIMPQAVVDIMNSIEAISDHVSVISHAMTDNEAKNLVRNCDCFVSLHRSEGFGRGLAEAMVLGKPVIATAYSGNMDFMNEMVSLPITFSLIPLLEGEYPQWQQQVWANPNVADAARKMIELLASPQTGRALGRNARMHMQNLFSYSAAGLRYQRRLDEISGQIQ